MPASAKKTIVLPRLALALGLFLLCMANNAAGQVKQAQIAWLWDADLPPTALSHHGKPSVAIVTEHILLTGDRLLHRPRKSWPRMAAASSITPLVHVEFDILHPPPPPTRFHAAMVQAVLLAATQSTSGWVQLDYEARPSHRLFFKALVHDIKVALPPRIKLSVTALAWWCRSHEWLDDLDADEVVPMFFKMGQSATQMNAILANSPQQLHARCRASARHSAIGFAVQEPPLAPVAPEYAKVYWFNYRRWKENSPWPPVAK